PLSASFRIPTIWVSLNFDFRMTTPDAEQSTLDCSLTGEAYAATCKRDRPCEGPIDESSRTLSTMNRINKGSASCSAVAATATLKTHTMAPVCGLSQPMYSFEYRQRLALTPPRVSFA